jgi:hypothetical protein
MNCRIALTTILFTVALTNRSAVGQDRPTALAVRINSAPVIDGDLSDGVWAQGEIITRFVQNEPFEGQPATERTEVKVLFDDHALYIGAWMFDRNPSGIVFGETRRDASLDDTDALLLVLDTYLDRQNGFVFGTTPAGIEYDGQVTREGQGGGGGPQRQQTGSGSGFNVNWDGSWDVATTRDEQGWYAEFRIPFSTLRFRGGGQQEWGLNISRNLRRRNEQAFWAPVPRQFGLYRVSQAGTLVGIEAPNSRSLGLTPYVLGSAARDYEAAAALGVDPTTDYDREFGADVKVNVTSSLSLDLTYNTDFAQVEVDDQQVNLTRFNLFFPEKRPFFLENAGTFSVGTPQDVELFFSRGIGIGPDGQNVPILGGGRLSGKVGGVALGLLNIQTDDGEDVLPQNYSVVRVAQEFPNRSRIGGIFVSRLNTDATSDYNLTYGIDGRLGVGDAVTFDAYGAKTRTPGIDSGEYAYSATGSVTTRDWSMGASFREVGSDFNPEVGFLPRSEYRFLNLRVLRNVRFPNASWFRELRPHASIQSWWGLDGFNETRQIHIDSHFEFSNGAFFQLPAVNFVREGLREPFEISPGVIVPPGQYDNFEWVFRYNSNRSANLSVRGSITVGGFYEGHRKGADTTIDARIGETLAAALRFSYDDVDLTQGSFNASLVSLRVAYSFTPRIYLQSLVQFNDQTDNFSSNIRFGWLNTAGTGLFIVYNDIERVSTSREFAPLNRALVVKFTQLFNVPL